MARSDQELEAFAAEVQTNPKAQKLVQRRFLSAANCDDPIKAKQIIDETFRAVKDRSVA